MKFDRRHFLAGAGAGALALALDPRAALAQGTPGEQLSGVFDRIMAGDLSLNPTERTSLGLDTGDHAAARAQLGLFGKPSDLAEARHAKSMLAELRAIDAGKLDEIGQVRRAVVEDMLEQRLISEPFGVRHVGAPYRLSQQDGAYFQVPDFLDSTHPVESADDAEAYLARLAGFSGALFEETEAQAEEAARGYAAPGWSLDLVKAQIEAQLAAAPGENGMVRSLASRAQEKNIAGDWAGRAAHIVETEVYPALRAQLALVEKLRPVTRAGDGEWRVPRGDEMYALALRHFTTTNLSADEIHKTGLEQVADLSAQLDPLLKGDGLSKGSIGARLAALNDRDDQKYPNTDEGRAALLESLNHGFAAMHGKLPRAFATVPDAPLEIRRVPVEIQEGAPNGYYYPPALDGSRPAIYWINLKDTADWPKYSLPALTYHEAEPGHHLHNSIVFADKDLPVLLKNYWLSAYGEGWALYAEMVADELGGYSGIEKAGALQSWLFRAARLVVDTGLNAKKWTVSQATDYLVDTTGFTRPRAQREIERYCASPGQACSYKIGQNEWARLRKRAEKELGKRFDLRQFHEILREGLMPLDLLDKRVGAWIAKVKAGA